MKNKTVWVSVHFIVYFFISKTGNQCLRYGIHISTPLSLASFILAASLIAKSVDQQKSKMKL